jgi:hypothetical protein
MSVFLKVCLVTYLVATELCVNLCYARDCSEYAVFADIKDLNGFTNRTWDADLGSFTIPAMLGFEDCDIWQDGSALDCGTVFHDEQAAMNFYLEVNADTVACLRLGQGKESTDGPHYVGSSLFSEGEREYKYTVQATESRIRIRIVTMAPRGDRPRQFQVHFNFEPPS